MVAKTALTFASVLCSFMEAWDIKGPEAAEQLGVTHGALYAWRRGEALPPRNQAERLAKKMNRPDLVGLIEGERERKRARTKAKKARAGAAS